MDLTLLLNSNGAGTLAAEQQKPTEEATKHRLSRTPWDAGGYSLPINTIAMTHSPFQHPQDEGAVRKDSLPPGSPTQHRLSDSRSSLSSFTSSLQSTTHSRYSSMSTVSSSSNLFQTYTLMDGVTPESRKAPDSSDLSTFDPHGSDLLSIANPSTTSSLNTTEINANQSSAFQKIREDSSTQEEHVTKHQVDNATISELEFRRPTSPSDAILIKRISVPTLRINTRDGGLESENELANVIVSSVIPLDKPGQLSIPFKSHKRSSSAPNLAHVGGIQLNQILNKCNDFTVEQNLGDINLLASKQPHVHVDFNENFRMVAEPTPPSSHHSEAPSPTTPIPYPMPDTPPRAIDEPEPHVATCMYIPNCDTDSQLRKAISHIFGRNKMCTRLIPQLVWVHYCRKHYQRSRYRNPKEYAKLQCDLVQEQIRRIHDWSEANAARGVAGVVQDWGLSVRKREAKRLEDAKNKKRRAPALDHEGSNDEDRELVAFVPPTAVPQWLVDSCGKGYSTQQILDIFNRLHSAVLQDLIPQFPDIEILPNIIADQDIPKTPKGYAKRLPSAPVHRRSRSLGVPVSSNYMSQNQVRSQSSSIWGIEDMGSMFPAQKRRRANEGANDEYTDRFHLEASLARNISDRPIDAGRRLQQLTHRPIFANIDEHQAAEPPYDEDRRQQLHNIQPLQNFQQGSLQAPVPQRSNRQSVAAHLEGKNHQVRTVGRPAHVRSQSEAGCFSQPRVRYASSPASSYVSNTDAQTTASIYQDQPAFTLHSQQFIHERSTPRINSSPRMPTSALKGQGHHRHQSTPLMPLCNPIFNFPYGQSLLPQQHRPFPQHQLHSMGHMPNSEHGRIIFPIHR